MIRGINWSNIEDRERRMEYRYLNRLIFAVDKSASVFWYFPPYDERDSNPLSVPIRRWQYKESFGEGMSRLLVLLALLIASAFTGCVQGRKITGAQCPCPKGFVCCDKLGVCLADTDKCPKTTTEDSGSSNDAVIEDGAETDGENPPQLCSDGKQDDNEECDDGNFNDNDGCTSLCEYGCKSDEDCDDLDSCSGTESCDAEHKCKPGVALPDFKVCENNKSCFKGTCILPLICGDGQPQSGEECDDGNTADNDGCTRECKFTCVSTDTARDCSAFAQCAPQSCSDTTHTCEPSGSAADDKTPCDLNGVPESGWCIAGQCVATNCGDGQVTGLEECDKGKNNGTEESGCTINCKEQLCGNSKVEVGEECDDGNRANFDSCDKNCKLEFWYRYNTMNITKEPAPSWCMYSPQNPRNADNPAIQESGGNQFGNAFPAELRVPGDLEYTTNVIYIINQLLNNSIDDCMQNVLNQVIDSEDLSFGTRDDDITINVYDGTLEPGEVISSCNNVDTRFYIESGDMDPSDPAIAKIKTAQQYSLIYSINPVNIQSMVPGIGTIYFYNLLAFIPVDTTLRSTPKEPPEVMKDPHLLRPKYIGNLPRDNTEILPKGRLCAAVSVASLKLVRVSSVSTDPLSLCCKKEGLSYTSYDKCAEGDILGHDCNTFMDVMASGCYACNNMSGKCGDACTASGGDMIEMIRAVEPDVDVDGDETKDAYSAVVAVDAVRVRVTGIRKK